MKFRLIAALAIALALPVQPLFSQSGSDTSETASDVWSTWRRGFENYEKAEKAARNKDFAQAISSYRASLNAFRAVRESNPNWNRSVISYRIDLCLRKIRAAQELQSAAAKKAAQAKPKAAKPAPKRPAYPREDFVTQSLRMRARLAEAEKEIASLKRSLELNAKAAEQVKNLIREKNELIEKNNMLNLLLEDSKEKLKRADRNRDRDRRIVEEKAKVTALSDKLRNLEVEMDTLKRQKAEAQSRRNEAELALRENVRQITALTASVESARLVQKENQLLLSQVVEMKKDRTELEQKLKDATKTISDLQTQLAKIREGIDLPENIRRIQDNANVVMKDNEYLRTLNTKNMQELELLRKSNATLSAELTKLSTQYKQTEAGYAQLTRQTRQTRQQLSEAEQRARSYQNASELLQKERDGLKTELSAFARRYESLLKNASRSDALSAELLKKEKELQEFARKTTELDLALAKLKKEHETALEALKKTGTEQSAAAVAKATADLKANVERLSAENLKLKVDSENLRTALSRSQELEKQVQKLNAENGELKRKAADFQKSLERFRKGADGKTSLAADYDSLKRRADELKRDLDRASADRAKLQDELKLTRNDAELLKKYKEIVANNNRLSAEYSALKKEFEQFKTSAAKINLASFSASKIAEENERLKREAADLRTKLDQQLRKAKENAASVADLTRNGQRLSASRAGELATENAGLKKEFDALKSALAIQTAQNASLQKALAEHQALQKKAETLIRENNRLQTDYAALQKASAKEGLSARIQTLNQENRNLRIEIETLQGSVERLMKLADNPQLAPSLLQQTIRENTTLRREIATQKDQIGTIREQLAANEARRKENDARLVTLLNSVRNSQEFIRQRDETIRGLTAQIERLRRNDPSSASKEIAALSATVTELKEGKVQFETALANLNEVRRKLEAENAALKNRLELAGRESEALRKQLGQPKPQGELERRNLELLEAASKYEKLYSKADREQKELTRRVQTLDQEIADANKRLAESSATIVQMRKELKEWTDDPISMNDQTVYKKNQALDKIVGENDSLRREVERLKAELSVSNDALRKSRLSMVAQEKRFREVLLTLKEYKQQNPDATLLIDSRKQDEAEREEEARLRKHQEIIARARQQQKKKAESGKAEQEKAGGTATLTLEKAELETSDASKPTDEAKYKSALSIARKAEQENNTAVALMNYWRAVDAWAESVEAHLGLARVYLARGDKASAQKAYETARKHGLKPSAELEQKLYGE